MYGVFVELYAPTQIFLYGVFVEIYNAGLSVGAAGQQSEVVVGQQSEVVVGQRSGGGVRVLGLLHVRRLCRAVRRVKNTQADGGG